MSETHIDLARLIAARFSDLPTVEAIALAGSLATEVTDSSSDIDLYVYTQTDLPPDERMAFLAQFSPDVILNDFWGAGNEWLDSDTGIHVDVMFWTVGWIEAQLDRVLGQHQASVGYSTSFWHTIQVSRPLFDRDGWFATLQQTAQQPYPEPLVRATIANNYPILRDIPSAYSHQLEKAIARRDLVSVNHRVAAFLESYFDILFALNRLPHPGEKRLLDIAEKQCAKLPLNMRQQVSGLIEYAVQMDTQALEQITRLVDGLDELLNGEALEK